MNAFFLFLNKTIFWIILLVHIHADAHNALQFGVTNAGLLWTMEREQQNIFI